MAKVKTAILSVSDKRGLVEFAKGLSDLGVEILSTGGTAKALAAAGLKVRDIADYTGFPEMMDGRIKTLHPKVHGGLLARRDNPEDMATAEKHGISMIDMIVVNLYPFEATIAKEGVGLAEVIENIDIGGPTMLRSAAKNYRGVAVICNPDRYDEVLAEMRAHDGVVSEATCAKLAVEVFHRTSTYDGTIAGYLGPRLADEPVQELRYGMNPHQKPARVYGQNGKLPFQTLNGAPGYINLLDAMNSWQLVQEMSQATGLPAAASFKHVSPSGAALAVPLSDTLAKAYFVDDLELSPIATAYARARGIDRMSSYGDFVALSAPADASLARLLVREVSDGVIAPGYSPEALEILKTKKNGRFLILQIDPDYVPGDIETRDVFGVIFEQKRNTLRANASMLQNVVTKKQDLPDAVKRDMLLAQAALKYTQSNTVCFVKDGQLIGMGAGQQSRVHCARLAASKVRKWWLRQHPAILALQFKAGVRRADRDNAVDQLLSEIVSPSQERLWENVFAGAPVRLSAAEQQEWMKKLQGVTLGSDGCIPFRDTIDEASHLGVQYIIQPGSSLRDDEVTQACNEYGMVMVNAGVRLFHH
jgi:phosphoribosylaminoimidazolecarboxamide formyltransferase / IMP cyclohydrolase